MERLPFRPPPQGDAPLLQPIYLPALDERSGKGAAAMQHYLPARQCAQQDSRRHPNWSKYSRHDTRHGIVKNRKSDSTQTTRGRGSPPGRVRTPNTPLVGKDTASPIKPRKESQKEQGHSPHDSGIAWSALDQEPPRNAPLTPPANGSIAYPNHHLPPNTEHSHSPRNSGYLAMHATARMSAPGSQSHSPLDWNNPLSLWNAPPTQLPGPDQLPPPPALPVQSRRITTFHAPAATIGPINVTAYTCPDQPHSDTHEPTDIHTTQLLWHITRPKPGVLDAHHVVFRAAGATATQQLRELLAHPFWDRDRWIVSSLPPALNAEPPNLWLHAGEQALAVVTSLCSQMGVENRTEESPLRVLTVMKGRWGADADADGDGGKATVWKGGGAASILGHIPHSVEGRYCYVHLTKRR